MHTELLRAQASVDRIESWGDDNFVLYSRENPVFLVQRQRPKARSYPPAWHCFTHDTKCNGDCYGMMFSHLVTAFYLTAGTSYAITADEELVSYQAPSLLVDGNKELEETLPSLPELETELELDHKNLERALAASHSIPTIHYRFEQELTLDGQRYHRIEPVSPALTQRTCNHLYLSNDRPVLVEYSYLPLSARHYFRGYDAWYLDRDRKKLQREKPRPESPQVTSLDDFLEQRTQSQRATVPESWSTFLATHWLSTGLPVIPRRKARPYLDSNDLTDQDMW